jgi:hypothetical protein
MMEAMIAAGNWFGPTPQTDQVASGGSRLCMCTMFMGVVSGKEKDTKIGKSGNLPPL